MQASWLFRSILAICLSACVPHALPQSSSSASAQTSADFDRNDPDRQQALQLYEQHKMPEAVALLEKVVVKYPKDVVSHEYLGVALLSRAETQTEMEKRRADRVHARAELLRARELGDHSDLCNTLLASIPEDGSESAFSNGEEANAAMKRGESAFAKGQWAQAIKEYSHALELDPKLYLAAVDIGVTGEAPEAAVSAPPIPATDLETPYGVSGYPVFGGYGAPRPSRFSRRGFPHVRRMGWTSRPPFPHRPTGSRATFSRRLPGG